MNKERIGGIYTMLASEKIAKNWQNTEEDKAWKHLESFSQIYKAKSIKF